MVFLCVLTMFMAGCTAPETDADDIGFGDPLEWDAELEAVEKPKPQVKKVSAPKPKAPARAIDAKKKKKPATKPKKKPELI